MADTSHPASSRPSGTILAISGSLRRASTNRAALRAAASAAARDGIRVEVADCVRALPSFDPDQDQEPPESVLRFWNACEEAVGVLLAVPEYTFGIPGWFKNALDWLVGSGSLYRKPIALLHVAPAGRGAHVRKALAHVLQAHNADVTNHRVPIAQRDREASGELTDPRIVADLRAVVAALAERTAARSAGAEQSLRRVAHN